MNWQEIIEFLGGAAVFGGVIAYLGKTAVDAYVSGRVESYKAEIQRVSTEHSVRFQYLHAERATAIRDLYAKIAVLDETLSSALRAFQLAGEPPLKDKISTLATQFNELRDFYLPRRIFFEPRVCELIDSALDTAKGIFFDITTYEVDPSHPQYSFDREILKERHEFWEKARAAHQNQFAEVKAKLERGFREILGIAV